MTKLRDRFEAAIEDASSGLHNSRDWWDDWYKMDPEDPRVIDSLLDCLVEIHESELRALRTQLGAWQDAHLQKAKRVAFLEEQLARWEAVACPVCRNDYDVHVPNLSDMTEEPDYMERFYKHQQAKGRGDE